MESNTPLDTKKPESNPESNPESTTESNLESNPESNLESNTKSNPESNPESNLESNTKSNTPLEPNNTSEDEDIKICKDYIKKRVELVDKYLEQSNKIRIVESSVSSSKRKLDELEKANKSISSKISSYIGVNKRSKLISSKLMSMHSEIIREGETIINALLEERKPIQEEIDRLDQQNQKYQNLPYSKYKISKLNYYEFKKKNTVRRRR